MFARHSAELDRGKGHSIPIIDCGKCWLSLNVFPPFQCSAVVIYISCMVHSQYRQTRHEAKQWDEQPMTREVNRVIRSRPTLDDRPSNICIYRHQHSTSKTTWQVICPWLINLPIHLSSFTYSCVNVCCYML